jgi:hypothetical protein
VSAPESVIEQPAAPDIYQDIEAFEQDPSEVVDLYVEHLQLHSQVLQISQQDAYAIGMLPHCPKVAELEAGIITCEKGIIDALDTDIEDPEAMFQLRLKAQAIINGIHDLETRYKIDLGSLFFKKSA